MWLILCLPVYAISLLGLLPETSSLRGTFMERMLDASLPIFLMSLTQKSVHVDKSRRPTHVLLVIFFISLVTLTAMFSVNRFGIDYFLVEYRQYILMMLSVAFLSLTRRKFSTIKILRFRNLYFSLLISVFLLNSIYGVQYRPGVFGESNYDLALLSIFLCTYLRVNQSKKVLFNFLAFVTLTLSRTGMAVLWLFLMSKTRKLIHVFTLGGLSFVIFMLLMARVDTVILTFEIGSVDRLVMLEGYFNEARSNLVFMLFGQPLTNSRAYLDLLSYYSDTQPVSAMLGITTPSNFHGHLLRGFSLLGVFGYTLFLILLVHRIRKNFSESEAIFIYILILVSGFTQSIFSHPLVGTILFAFLWVGFSGAGSKPTRP